MTIKSLGVACVGLAAAITFQGCGGGGPDGYVGDMERYTPRVRVVSGDNQTAPVNTAFPQRITVRVSDDTGRIFPTAAVWFQSPSSGPSCTFPGNPHQCSGTTDSQGVAISPEFTANDQAGTYEVKVSVNGGFTAILHFTNQ
ncbi:MAG TPA: hypothetical protein VJ623_06045 [Holophagaceae bacterium]|nr:hypothetical protein [Holophagaceae bacterium]